jgi:hypothetical protein
MVKREECASRGSVMAPLCDMSERCSARKMYLDRLEVVVQLIYKGHRGGDVEVGDDVLGDVVEVLDESAQGVAVGRDEELLVRLDDGHESLLESWSASWP